MKEQPTLKNKNQYFFLKELKDYLPLVYIGLILISFTLLNAYYKKFDINIENYLSLQEVIYLFLPLSELLILFMVFIVFAFLISKMLYIENKDPSNNTFYLKNTIKKTPKWLRKSMNYFMYSFICGISFYDVELEKHSGIIVLILTVIFLLLFMFTIISKFHEAMYYENLNSIKNILFLVIITFFSFSLFYQRIQAQKIKSGNSKFTLQLIREKDTITTNNTLIYFGETKDNYFLRDINNKQNMIISKKGIKMIIKKKVNK
ncbi:hypothetical protein BA195_02680 [Tenacibaculum soleae]|uniref:Uncharacterized protein n=1 Tax=Tenacibaculum soleae TaxID=447689 RepID=A0A1B9Y1J1_9FLAO|nr:hypothetical protein [Tenacibaculum soleae]OCK43626.1 hypothetical protein BA195_02680 [Tenacibaculum soleae]